MSTNISLDDYKELEKERDNWKEQYLEAVEAYKELFEQYKAYDKDVNEKVNTITLNFNRVAEEYKTMWSTLSDIMKKAGDCLLEIDQSHTEFKND